MFQSTAPYENFFADLDKKECAWKVLKMVLYIFFFILATSLVKKLYVYKINMVYESNSVFIF